MVKEKKITKTKEKNDTIRERIAKFEEKEKKITKEFNEAISGLSLLL